MSVDIVQVFNVQVSLTHSDNDVQYINIIQHVVIAFLWWKIHSVSHPDMKRFLPQNF